MIKCVTKIYVRIYVCIKIDVIKEEDAKKLKKEHLNEKNLKNPCAE